MKPYHERAEIKRQLKSAIERHRPSDSDSEYPKAEMEIVVQSVVDSGYDREAVEDVLDQLLRVGELYEAGSGKLGVV